MATRIRTPRAPRTANDGRLVAAVRRGQAVTVTRRGRDVMVAEAKEREDCARRALALSLARMEHDHVQAMRRLAELDEFLSGVRGRLRHAGYVA
jgi:antitoxin (DNA-binding transcriptional repressor) of toxin-antitoxin stability system